MFEAAELGRSVPNDEYKQQVEVLRAELLEVQDRLQDAGFSVIVVFAGVDGAGKGATANLLNAWMDPRGIVTRAYGEPSDEERERPLYWRYWRGLPPKGKIGIFLGSWYSRPILNRVYRKTDPAAFDRQLTQIVNFERELAEDDTLILKFWMHLGKKAQKQRLQTLEKDPNTRWRVSKTDWKHYKLYHRFVAAAEEALHKTGIGEAPWMIVEGVDANYRELTVGTSIRDAIRKHLADLQRGERRKAADPTHTLSGGVVMGGEVPTVLSQLDMDQSLSKKTYREQLEKYQGRLNLLFRRAKARRLSVVSVFEGVDAGGKGGAIRRTTAALDARDYEVIPIAAPTDEERAQHYLWRFWRHIPRAGRFTIFDRSWYGRVLVERIEGFATENAWRRAYAEITDFEEQLTESGIVLAKFWLQITQDEQLRRFEARRETPYKRYKLTEEDWRNREKWDLYELAVNDMVERTSTQFAPWTLVEGNDKRFARIKVLKTLCASLERALERDKS
jgi:polyphosphate:AMP phosphotransferase